MSLSVPAVLTFADARWQSILTDRPDLAPAVDLQRLLLERVLQATAEIEKTFTGSISSDQAIAAKLSRGVPALRGDFFPFPIEPLHRLLVELCDVMAEGGAGNAASHIKQTLDDGEMDVSSLLWTCLVRNHRAVRLFAQHKGLAPDLLWLLAELAVSPVAHLAAARLLGNRSVSRQDEVDSEGSVRSSVVQDALAQWDRGYCPACGSWPAFGQVLPNDRPLGCCAFCGAQWHLPSDTCTYCGAPPPALHSAAPDLERPTRRLELCDSCHGYLKMMDESKPIPFPLAAIEDLATMDLDVAAMDRDYRRPFLADLPTATGAPEPPPCVASDR